MSVRAIFKQPWSGLISGASLVGLTLGLSARAQPTPEDAPSNQAPPPAAQQAEAAEPPQRAEPAPPGWSNTAPPTSRNAPAPTNAAPAPRPPAGQTPADSTQQPHAPARPPQGAAPQRPTAPQPHAPTSATPAQPSAPSPATAPAARPQEKVGAVPPAQTPTPAAPAQARAPTPTRGESQAEGTTAAPAQAPARATADPHAKAPARATADPHAKAPVSAPDQAAAPVGAPRPATVPQPPSQATAVAPRAPGQAPASGAAQHPTQAAAEPDSARPAHPKPGNSAARARPAAPAAAREPAGASPAEIPAHAADPREQLDPSEAGEDPGPEPRRTPSPDESPDEHQAEFEQPDFSPSATQAAAKQWAPEPGAAPPAPRPLDPSDPWLAATEPQRKGAATKEAPLPRPEEVTRRQAEYLLSRFDLSGQTHPKTRMSGGSKAVPVGPTARLPAGVSWDQLARMRPAQIRKRGLFPFVPLWHPLQEAGGMVFPPAQTGVAAGLERADVWFDLPETYLPEFPPPLYLTSRPDLGNVSQGQLITLENADALFRDILTPAQLEGLKLMLKKVPAPHHNRSERRATLDPAPGVACMDCHVNGHTTAQFSLSPDVRPHRERFRVDTASLRGAFANSWFGYKRALRGLEQFIASEGAPAYFAGDMATAERHGAHKLTPQEVDAIAQFTRIIDFPPAPKLDPQGRLDRKKASPSELRGEKVFTQHCSGCHTGQYFTDNMAHDLRVERFYSHVGSSRVGAPGRAEGPFRTPSLRGVKDSPPYLHDGRLLTLEDAVEFFNLVLQLRLSRRERADLADYLRTL